MQQGEFMKNLFLVMTVVVCAVQGRAFADETPTAKTIDLREELKEQIALVQEGRNVIVDYNDPSNLAGTSFFCNPKADGSDAYELDTSSSYYSDAKLKADVKDLDTPQLRQRILEKGGSLSGFGAEASVNKKRLIQTSVSELVRLEVDKATAPNLAPIVKAMRAAGARDDQSFCYLWSVKGFKAEILVNMEQKFSLSTPAIFVVTGKASFLQSDKLVNRTYFATYLASRYVVKNVEDQLKKPLPLDKVILPVDEDLRNLVLSAPFSAPE